jgi:hypothetical protein
MTQEQKINEFAKTLRRVLYLFQILEYNLDDLKTNSNSSPTINNEVRLFNYRIKALKSEIKYKVGDNWKHVNQELNSDRLHDISLLLERISNVDNISEITEIINQNKIMKDERTS